MRRAKPKTDLGTEQARRVIYMYNKFLDGNSYSSAEMYDEILRIFKVNLSLRTVQRDLRTLHEMVPNMEQVNVGRQVYWRLAKTSLEPPYMTEVEASDMLSFYFLKSYLKQFKHSIFEKEVDKLARRLDHQAPGNAYLDESIYWISEHGKFNYKNFSSIFEELISATIEKKWLNITYKEPFDSEIHHQFALFRGFFAYRGSVYFIAFVPRKHGHIAIQLENISKTAPAQPYNDFIPDFSPREFFENRFGTSEGEQINAELYFNQEAAPIYANRQWHPKQESVTNTDGSVTLKFPIILNPELIKWIISMGKGVKVIAPQVLVDAVKEEHMSALKNYQ